MHVFKARIAASRFAAVPRAMAFRAFVGLQTTASQLKREVGQTVAEYALVLLVAAAIAGAFLFWAKSTGKLDAFFDAIFGKLLNSVDASSTPAP